MFLVGWRQCSRGVSVNALNTAITSSEKSDAKPFTAALVPGGRFHDVILSFRAYNYTPSHCLKRERMRAFDSSSGIDESGSA